MSLGLFDLTGGPFLATYATLLAAAIAAGILIPRWMRPHGREQYVEDIDTLAYLAGGGTRLREALVARLLAVRALAVAGRGRFRVVSRPPTVSPAEALILTIRSSIGWREIGDVLRPHEERLTRRLTAAGLVIENAKRARIRFWTMLPYVALLAFGATELMVGEPRPTAYATAALIATALLAVHRWARIDRRTRAGHSAVAKARSRADRLRIAPTRGEAALAVALFGTPVLAGSGWSEFHRVRRSGTRSHGRSSSFSDLIDSLTDLIDSLADWIDNLGYLRGDGGGDGAGCGGGCGG